MRILFLHISGRAAFKLCAAAFLIFSLLTFFAVPSQAACLNPAGTAGQLLYDEGDSVMVYCDNTNWIEFPKVTGGGGGGGDPQMVMVSTGRYHACGLKDDGTAWCWGDGMKGQLGNNNTADQYLPVQVGTSGTGTLWTDWTYVSASLTTTSGHSCGIRSNGTAWCWGEGSYGKLGNNGTSDQMVPVQVGTSGTGTLFTDWVSITPFGSNTCGLRSNGTAWCWGYGYGGSIGNGSSADRYVPTQVGTSGSGTLWNDWSKIDGDCGIRNDGSAWCWGRGTWGQIGDNNNVNRTVPTRVGTSGSGTLWSDWTDISYGYLHNCGVRSNGTAWCWGNAGNGQLGNNNTVDQYAPVQVGTSGTGTLWGDWQSISSGYAGSCGVRSNGTAWCWGKGLAGQLGNDSETDSFIPVQVGTSTTTTLWSDWGGVDIGEYFACGIRNNNHGWCWGSNSNGKLGVGYEENFFYPVAVGIEKQVVVKNTNSVKSGSSPWNSGSVSISEGNSLLVCVSALGTVSGVTWGGQPITAEATATSATVNTYIYASHGNTAATGDIVVTLSGAATAAIIAAEGVNISASPFDKTSSASGSSTSPSSGLTAATAQEEEVLFGCIGTNGPSDDTEGSWLGMGSLNVGALNDLIGTTGQSGSSNVSVSAGVSHVYDIGSYKAAKVNISSRDWTAAITTYKSPTLIPAGGAGCSSPTGIAGMMIYDTGDNVMTYCNGSSWVEAGPSPGAGGTGCSSPPGTAGAMIYDTGDSVLTYCDGTNWVQIGK